MKKTFYFVRHGETDWSVVGRNQGWFDIPLNNNGIEQVNELAKKLSDIKLDCIYTSPLLRSLDTAKIVSEKNNVKIIIEDGLKEWNTGIFSGKIIRTTDTPIDTSFDINSEIIHIPFSLITSDSYTLPNGENYNKFTDRIYDTMVKIAKNTKCKTVGISTHGNVIKAFLQKIANVKYTSINIPHASYIKVRWNGNNFKLLDCPDCLVVNTK